MKTYEKLAMTIQARINCIASKNDDWINTHETTIDTIMKSAPSGSGFDSGTKIDLDKSDNKKLVFNTAFHHLNDDGYYIGWSHHTVIVTPDFNGIDIRITGKDKRDIKDYIAETFSFWLDSEVKE